jgi:hypothetical protein
MLPYLVAYEVKPGANLPEGLPRQSLVVLSSVWRGAFLRLEYPDGDTEIIEGRTMSGEGCQVQVFWTRKDPRGPAVCLAIGGDAGLRRVSREEDKEVSRGAPFLALAEGLIPPDVLAVVGPPPEKTPLLLG